MKTLKIFIVSVLVFLLLSDDNFAQPDLSKPLEPTIADIGSKFYRFEKFEIDSNDGERHYKIAVGIPKTAEPEKTYPVLYLLDGNAALAALNDDLFSRLESLPVIVSIGYNTEFRFDVVSRAFDYTPALPDHSQPNDERGRKGGGADIFAELIEIKIKPKVESFVRIDKQRQTIWGHSYGGLFVLNTLFKHPEMFQSYVAADPSFWWQNGVILKIEDQFMKQIEKKGIEKNKLRLAVFVGRGASPQHRNTERPADSSAERNAEHNAERSANLRRSAPPNAAEDLVKRFESQLKTATFRVFEGLSHGQMLPASLEPALRFCAQ